MNDYNQWQITALNMRFLKKKTDDIISAIGKYFKIDIETVAQFLVDTPPTSGYITTKDSNVKPTDVIRTINEMLMNTLISSYENGTFIACLIACISILKTSKNKQLNTIGEQYTEILKELM